MDRLEQTGSIEPFTFITSQLAPVDPYWTSKMYDEFVHLTAKQSDPLYDYKPVIMDCLIWSGGFDNPRRFATIADEDHRVYDQ